ncbi:hypothetical protein ACFVU2_18250 [Leifsonia sp. NPDC058194]|uniref:hypothetical protein n=1 Tax=Leifsonia sp. NPDC058194 TaxID=3346374 RepID=UPI0036DDCFA8
MTATTTHTGSDTVEVAPHGEAPGGFEYRRMRVPRRAEGRQRDLAARFGWLPDGSGTTGRGRTVEIGLKRPLELAEREALVRLEHDSDQSLATIESLERSRTRVPALLASAIGVIGAAAMAVSVFALQADDVVSSIVGGVLGILLWLAAPIVHRFASATRTRRVAEQIHAEEEVIGSIGRQAVSLRSGSGPSS